MPWIRMRSIVRMTRTTGLKESLSSGNAFSVGLSKRSYLKRRSLWQAGMLESTLITIAWYVISLTAIQAEIFYR